MLTPVSSDIPTLNPDDNQWGNNSGPLDITVKYEIITQPREWCPHCNQEIREKEYYCDPNDKWYHRGCKGELNRLDTPTDAAQIFGNLLAKSAGFLENTVIPTENGVLLEALPKSVKERIHRRTRVVSNKEESRPEPVIKRDADNDPRQTSRGRASLRGSRKKNRNKKMARRDWYNECVQFLRLGLDRPAVELIEAASKLRKPLAAVEFFTELKSYPNLNQSLIENGLNILQSVLEAKGYRKSYYGMIGQKSESDAAELAQSKMHRVGKFLKGTWVEKIEKQDIGMVEFVVNGDVDYNGNYVDALNSGRVYAKID